MGGGGSKASSATSNGSHGGLSSAHAVVPAWSAGAPPLPAPRLPPRRARRTLEQHTLKAPASRVGSDGYASLGNAGGYEKSDVVVMASPAKGVDPAPKLGQLKGMLQNGLIEQSDYDERKRQLLDGMILEEFDDVLAIADRALAGAAASGLSPTGSLGAGLEVEPSVLLKTARARVLVKPLDEDLDPWDRQRWWESDVGREERLLKLCAGTDALSWHAISSGEKLGEISLRNCAIRRTTTRPRGQGAPGFVLISRAGSEGEAAAFGAPHRTACHVRMLATDGGGETAGLAEFEDWMDALAPFLPRQGVGVSLRFLQRFMADHPEIASSSSAKGKITAINTTTGGPMTCAEVYERFISEGLLATESYVERLLRDPNSSSAGRTGKQPHEIGPTTSFVSHSHDSSFSELVATLAQTELTAQKADQQQFRSYYWIDLFCQPAHGPKAAARARTEEAKERAAIRRAFGEADVERSGSLAMDGFAAALRNVGVYHPEALLRELLASLDVSGRCTRIELPEFEAVVSEYRKTHPVAPLGPVSSPLKGDRAGDGSVGEELDSRRRCIASAWHPSGVPTLLLIVSEWPAPKALVERLGCWHELLLSIEVGADTLLELSPAARAGFVAQVRSGELSFTLDQRPRWNRGRPHSESGGVDGYSSGPVAQAIDIRAVAAYAKRRATNREREEARKRMGGQLQGQRAAPMHWLVGPGLRAEEVDWVVHQAEQLPTLTVRGQGGRWVTRGVERLNTAVRSALEEEIYSLYQDSVFTGPVLRD